MALFALVHGAWHGAWCWDKVVPELESRGHRTVAMDMPLESKSRDAYADAVVDAIEPVRGDDDLILVGHSMAGLVIPYVAERVPAKHLVYLAALLPKPGRSVTELFAEETEMLGSPVFQDLIDTGDGMMVFKEGAPTRWFYHDCTETDAEWATSMLRPQYQGRREDPPPIDIARFPSTYVACAQDLVVLPEWGRKRAKEWLGVDAVVMDASHSPFLSKPAELADILVGVA